MSAFRNRARLCAIPSPSRATAARRTGALRRPDAMLRRTFTKVGRVSAVKAAVALGSALDVARWHAGPLQGPAHGLTLGSNPASDL